MKLYQGLLKIEKLKLPHPIWQFIKSGDGLVNMEKIDSYAGWTIRTVKISKGLYKNLYVNWLPLKKVKKKVDEFQEQLKDRGLFVVYPSWRWQMGGTLLIEKDRQIVEAIKGEIVDLARHGINQSCYIFKKGRLIEVTGKRLLDKKVLIQIKKAIKVLNKDTYLEWAVTTQGKFIFYRMNDLRSEAKHLINKYNI